MKKIKPLKPCLQEKKRYLAFEIISKTPIKAKKAVKDSLKQNTKEFLGILESAKAGIIFVDEKYNEENQKGILRVNHKYLDKLKASLCFVEEIQGQKVIVRSLGASGMINKAYEHVKK